MIEITYKYHGARPSQTDIIREDANSANTLPASFAVEGVRYDDPEFTLLVEPPSDSISQDAIDSIATAFENRWGTMIEHIDTVVVN